MLNPFRSYFNWLQKGVPTGEIVRYPVIGENYQSQVEGLYIVGDLSGLPLLKFAAKQGYEVITRIVEELKALGAPPDSKVYDVVIIGAGAAGLAGALHAKKMGLHYVVLEGARIANTIVNFPKGKLIFAEPMQIFNPSELPVVESTREETLDTWFKLLDREKLNIQEGMNVTDVRKGKDGIFEVIAENQTPLQARRVVLATGKAGKSRRLEVPGENLEKVADRLFSPKDYHDQNILVVGGGDSAVETAVALAETGNKVTLSYRKGEFSRIKEGNFQRISELEKQGSVTILFNSNLKEITQDAVILTVGKELRTLPNDLVFTMIGKELPYEFLERIGITIENTWNLARYVLYGLSVYIFTLVYFGKKIAGTQLLQTPQNPQYWDWWAVPALTVFGMMLAVFVVYVRMNRQRYGTLKSMVPPLAVLAATMAISLYSLYVVSGHKDPLTGQPATYIIKLFGVPLDPPFWYGALYSLTITIFGIRRIATKKSAYITKQTLSLIFFQTFMLFILPYALYFGDVYNFFHLPKWLDELAFPGKSYWRAYGLVLAFPLFIYNLLEGQPITFWLWMTVAQTFVMIPTLIYFFGKGAYCGWICSCGGLAETLGDSYRTLAPHGEKAKRMENIGQVVLGAVLLLTVMWMLGHWTPEGSYFRTVKFGGHTLAEMSEHFKHYYELLIDVTFAGTIGLGAYFFYSGRIWCRYGCPLAALMHIYTRFSRYRIFADKKKCISCNICTKMCHMGIDVMGYASQGKPMDDVECVRCSACVVSCPMDVLSFGRTGTGHPHDPGTKLHQLSYNGKGMK
ncbi:MAG: NAD(P)-binding domain-containing protein [Blastocatellia bacterium]|nr:NAD(P)-binding domain-containing protein [Blastocatellia bacterium]